MSLASLTSDSQAPVWRFIPLLQAPGRVQMAIDQWLLEQHLLGQPSTLRFYTWSSPTISLGYHQRQWPEFWQHLTWQGKPVELIRRPTGGRAVLHQGDLTYAVVTAGLSSKRLAAYTAICEFLIQGWRSLGLDLHYGSSGRGYIHNPSCFSTATGADLVLANGYKFIGSAQMRRQEAILQHGSMRLSQDAGLFAQVFRDAVEPPIDIPFAQRGDALIQTVVDALTTSASRCFGIRLQLQPLSEAEWEAIMALPSLEIDKLPKMLRECPHHTTRNDVVADGDASFQGAGNPPS
jgi:lipoate-protein ligase A